MDENNNINGAAETRVETKAEKSKFNTLISVLKKGVKIMIFVTVASMILGVVSAISADFAEGYTRTVGRFLRMVLAKISGIFPFSLAETLLVAGVVLVIYSVIRMIFEAIKNVPYEKRYELVFSRITIICLLAALSLYNFAFSPANKRYPVERNFDLSRGELTAQQLYDCIVTVEDEIYKCLEEGDIRALPSGSTIMPYSFAECNARLNDIYKEASKKYPFIDGFSSKAKTVALSELMTHTHISGIYTPYTGEININVNYPDYVTAFSMGHEMAHQRGIAREDEANFVAFVVMYESDDLYLRYCALTELFSYLTDALYVTDEELFAAAMYRCDDRVLYEMIGFADFFAPYESSPAASISESINDASIKLRGDSAGTQSYNKMVELAAAYFDID